MDIFENILLSTYTTLRVGGVARYFCMAASEDDIRQALEFARDRGVAMFVMGGGSNLVVSDSGWPGLVVRISIPGVESSLNDAGERIFSVGAGVDWDSFVESSVRENCAGIECLSGIPGTVGATPIQNVGAYGQEVAQTIVSVRCLEVETGEPVEFSHDDCAFGYRTSLFNTEQREKFIVTSVTFRLRPGGLPALTYADLVRYFYGKPYPTLLETREAVRQIRRGKAMLIVPGDPDRRSAGSFFKNPIVDSAKFEELQRIAVSRGLKLPSFPADGNAFKIPAAWLVERSGFHKGDVHGKVGISSKHALAIVNYGGGTAREILGLKSKIQAAVRNKWGIELQPEPVLVGDVTGVQ